MRIKCPPVLAIGTDVDRSVLESPHGPVRADEAPLSGNWKLVVLAFGDDEFTIFKLSEKEGKTTATVADAQQMLEERQGQVRRIRRTARSTLILTGPGRRHNVQGQARNGRADAGKFLGTIDFRGGLYPARVETTEESKVAPPRAKPFDRQTPRNAARRAIPSPRSRSSRRRSTAITAARSMPFSMPSC